MSRLIVKNLPQQTTEKSLRDLFGKKGTITDCSLKYKDGKFRRFAFIGYSSEEEAQVAQKYFDKTFINTSRIQVEIAVDLGHTKPKPWSKYSKDQEPLQKSELEQKEEKKKKKKEEKEAALLGELHKDPEFKEYLAAYTPKNRKTWGNDATLDNDEAAVDDDSSDDEGDEKKQKDEDETDDEKSEDEKKEKDKDGKTKQMTDLDFLKSKMANSTLLSSDEDEDDDDSSSESNIAKASAEKEKKQKNVDKDGSLKTPPKKMTEKQQETEEPPRQKFCLKMKGLAATIKESAIREFFKPFKVKIRMPTNKQKLSIGIAFIECRSEKDLEAALGKNKSFIGKKKVFLKRVFEDLPAAPEVQEKPRPWEKKAENMEEEESIAESGRLFVRNLAYQCTEETLEPLFAKFGPVTEFDLPVDPFTKKIKGFAHVTFMMPEHAVKAYTELDGKAFMGRMLHILPGKDREEKYTSTEKSSFKKQKDEKTKALAKSSHNWNTLFLSSNAVATAMATKYQTDKSHILDDSGKGSLGVRMALGETQLVQETRQFLIENGVALDSFSQADGERSKTVILAKDLPAETQADELREVFSKYGTVNKVVLPPHGSTAIIEFQEPSEAKRAFTKLAYRRFKYLPLYLEWAPMAVFNKDSAVESETLNEDQEMQETEEKAAPKPSEATAKKQEDSGVESESDEESEPGSTVFVKNLNFDTQEGALKELFSKAGDVRRVTIAKKKDMKNPGKFLSMGYGFVEYKKAASAMESLKTLQKAELDGHTLELKISHRETLQPKSSRKKQSSSQKGSTKILIRNIPFQCNKKEIEELFKVFGELKYVRVPKKSSGPGIQGFGFVDFLTKQDAKRAFDALCHSTHLYGRRLVLEWANTVETVEDLQRKTAQKFHDGGPSRKLRKKALMEALE